MTSFVGRCFFIFFCGTLCLAFALWPGYLFGSITMGGLLMQWERLVRLWPAH